MEGISNQMNRQEEIRIKYLYLTKIKYKTKNNNSSRLPSAKTIVTTRRAGARQFKRITARAFLAKGDFQFPLVTFSN